MTQSNPKALRYMTMGIVALLLLAAAFFLYRAGRERAKDPEKTLVLEVGEEKVYLPEAMVYYELTRRSFQEMGGEGVFDLGILGIDPNQTAFDRAMASMIRVKVVLPLSGSIHQDELRRVHTRAQILKGRLGEEFLARHGIDEALLERIMEENYLAYRYEQDVRFLASDFEEEINQGLQEAYGRYDAISQEEYLYNIALKSMMFYTGQWVAEEWVSYSDTQQAMIREEAQRVRDLLTPRNFTGAGESFADSIELENNPVFHAGEVISPYTGEGWVYLGQIQEEAAGVIRELSQGQISPIIETPYGYLITYVSGRRDPRPADYGQYEAQLKAAREAYRSELIESLKTQRMEEEWQRLEEESEIRRYDQAFLRALTLDSTPSGE